MRNLIYTTLLIGSTILSANSEAQKVSDKVEISTSKKYGKGNSITDVYCDNNNKFYTITWGSEMSKINFLNDKLEVEKSVEAYIGKNFRGLLTINKELYLFRMSKSKEDINKMVYAKINPNSTSVTDNILMEKKEDKGKIVQSDYKVTASPDGKLFAVYYKYILKDAAQSIHEVTIYDSLFNKVYSQSYTNLFNGESVIDKEMYLTNSGKFIWKYTTDKSRFVAIVEKDKTSPIKLEVAVSGKRLPDFSICIGNDERCILTGPYFDLQGNTPVGVYSMKLDLEKGELGEAKTSKFTFKLPEGPDAHSGSGFNDEKFNYIPLKPIFHDNGTVSVLFEQSFAGEYATANGEGTYYYKYDVIVARVDINSSEIKYTTSLKKMQEVEKEEFSSVVCTQRNNKLYVIFNDHIDNINNYDAANLKEMKSGTMKFKESGIVLIEIGEDGNQNREIFYRDDENKDATIFPIYSAKAKNDNLYLFLKHEQSSALAQDWSKNFTYLTVKFK